MLKKESLRHREAFEHYYAQGDKRTYAAVSKEFGVSLTAVAKWAKSFNWQERVEQRDIEIARALEEKTNTTIISEKARYRNLIRANIGRFVELLNERKVGPESVADLERLIKLDLLLMGEATERTETNSWLDIMRRVIDANAS